MKKFFSFLAAALMTGSMAAGTLIDYNSTPTLPAGITISGTTKMANVKIHTNTDGVDCIQLANGYNASGVYNGNAIILHTEGGFKAGDTLKVAGFFNNSDETKVAKAEIFTVDADNNCTAVWTSQQFINGRTSAADPAIEAYVLAADMDSIMIGRNGGTGTNICKLSIVRPEAAPTTLATFSISSAEIVAGQVGDIALGTNGYGSQAVADPATWYTCAKGDYTFKGAKVCVATASNGGGIQMQGNASDVAKMGFFGNATAFNNIHSVKVVLRTTSTATYVPVFNIYTDSLGTTTALAAPDTVLTTEGGFKKFVYTYSYAEPGKFFNIKDDLAGALYIDSIYVTYEKGDEPAAEYDGTITTSLDNATISSLSDLANIQLTFVDATTITLSDDDEFMGGIYLQNKSGSEVYAVWHPALGHTYTINGNVVTLSGFEKTALLECVDLPAESATLYLEDMGSFVVDGGDVEYFESAEIAYEAAPATTYTITYTVIGDNPSHCGVTAGYFNEIGEGKAFVAGANIVPDNMTAYVYITVIDGYTAEVKINDAAVTLIDNYWEEDVTADMTIEVIFSAPATINYWLVGPAAENGWDQTKAMPMPGDSIVRHLAAGTYEFKVLTQEASWTGALGYADLNAEASSANVFGSDNVCFELENEGDVIIKVVEGQIVVLGTFKEQVVADYYIKFAGNNWTWVPMTTIEGAYEYDGVWGGTGANVNDKMEDASATWYPEASIEFVAMDGTEAPVAAIGTEGTYVYTSEPAKLYFRYEFVPTALHNVESVKATKVIENGKVVILKNGVRYNVLGAQF